MACAASTELGGMLDRGWRVAPQVAVRPEPFGALVYHFGTRRLTFLKSRLLLDVVDSLGQHESARDACRAAGVNNDELPRYEKALSTLAAAGHAAVVQWPRLSMTPKGVEHSSRPAESARRRTRDCP